NLAMNLDLAAEVHQKRAVRDVDHPDAGGLLEAVDDLSAVDAVPGVDRDVADDPLTTRFDEVYPADVPSGVPAGPRHPPHQACPTRPSMPGRFWMARRTVRL